MASQPPIHIIKFENKMNMGNKWGILEVMRLTHFIIIIIVILIRFLSFIFFFIFTFIESKVNNTTIKIKINT